jgi:hypothetical protein
MLKVQLPLAPTSICPMIGWAWNSPRSVPAPPPIMEVVCLDTLRDPAHTDLEVD